MLTEGYSSKWACVRQEVWGWAILQGVGVGRFANLSETLTGANQDGLTGCGAPALHLITTKWSSSSRSHCSWACRKLGAGSLPEGLWWWGGVGWGGGVGGGYWDNG